MTSTDEKSLKLPEEMWAVRKTKAVCIFLFFACFALMPSYILFQAKGFELVKVPVPKPKDDEVRACCLVMKITELWLRLSHPQQVLIKVLACSLCGTDIHVHDWDPPFCEGRMKPPVTTGHEVCGEVLQAGSKVTTLAVGDLVSAESHIPCKSQPT